MQTMAETATETITIAAPPDQVWAIATDLERYPQWAHDVKDVVITSRDADGRPSQVEFRTSALGRSTHYTLQYDYSSAPSTLAWTMVKGDIQRSIEGAYRFEPAAGKAASFPIGAGFRIELRPDMQSIEIRVLRAAVAAIETEEAVIIRERGQRR